VLHILGRLHHGGAEMRALDLLKHNDQERFEQSFCTLSALPGVLDDEFIRFGGRIYPCPLNLQFPRNFRRILHEQQIQVVHSHVHMFSGYILRLARKEKVQTRIAHFRSMSDGHRPNLRRRLQTRLMRHWIDRHATNILAVGEGAMTAAWGKNWRDDQRCEVIYTGLDVDQFNRDGSRQEVRRQFDVTDHSLLFIHVGRLAPEKNHKKILSVFSEIIRRRPDSRLLLAGTGDPMILGEIKSYIQEQQLTEKVILAGDRNDVPRLLTAADSMIFPSVREGLPGAVLEACASGLGVIASHLPGNQEIADRMGNVITLSLDENDESWAEAAIRSAMIYSSRDVKKRTAEEFRSSVFTIERCVYDHQRIWKGLT
jgi:glycosyltransferase involved in cell wall biosynthesis